MILYFPDPDTLRLALTSGVVPPEVALAPARSAPGEQRGIWVEPTATLSRGVQQELRRLGVSLRHDVPVPVTEEATCWLQLLALERRPTSSITEQAAVLFDLPEAHFAGVVAELLRLGNDRQGFRWFSSTLGQGQRVLLRVIAPPYYTLLRAIDNEGKPDAPIAFMESAPRVWIQLGFSHPLAAQIKVSEGALLLMRPPRNWLHVPDEPLRDIYEVLEFPLANQTIAWQPREVVPKKSVPLRLTADNRSDPPELWVVRDQARAQLSELVSGADNLLLRQLSFAVATDQAGRETIVLRLRPTREAPPVLVLIARGFRRLLKLPNLFVPCGYGLQPPLRRDIVRDLLATDPDQITWLEPADNGQFVAETLPDQAFQPLEQWVEYIIDRESVALQTWVQSTRFDFESFIGPEEESGSLSRRSSPQQPQASLHSAEHIKADELLLTNESSSRREKEKSAAATATVLSKLTPTPTAQEPSELERQLSAVEEQFRQMQGPLDAPERRALWSELAALNAALHRSEDAAHCSLNALWPSTSLSSEWLREWLRAAAQAVPDPESSGWTSMTSDTNENARLIDALMASSKPGNGAVMTLAALVTWAGNLQTRPHWLAVRLQHLQSFLEAHEHVIPVRAAWLAWLALCCQAGGDVLTLARARDRLLARLYPSGLRPDVDLPSFLRFAGKSSERSRAARTWLVTLRERVHGWIKRMNHKSPVDNSSTTTSYADLILAFAQARLGEAQVARLLLHGAQDVLMQTDSPVHELLMEAFTYRVEEALNGKRHAGPLTAEIGQRLASLKSAYQADKALWKSDPSYVVDRLRQHSRILEPEQQIEAYRHIFVRAGAVEAALAHLPDIQDPQQLRSAIGEVLKLQEAKPVTVESRAALLRQVLDQSPRTDQRFTVDLLNLATEFVEAVPAQLEAFGLDLQLRLLEKAMFVAAHFDAKEHVRRLAAQLHRLLEAQSLPGALRPLEALAGQCFRGMRRLGLSEQNNDLVELMLATILRCSSESNLQGLLRRFSSSDREIDMHLGEALGALLQVAAGWYYFGRDADAEPILEAARAMLYDEALEPAKKTRLACAYAAALAQAPLQLAQTALGELFSRLDKISDSFTTSEYFSLSQLRLIEAIIWTAISDEFQFGTEARRWLDDDEYLVRKRIHSDMRSLMEIP